MIRHLMRLLGVSLLTIAFPAAALAQASIAGVITDSSGSVLPGVTVEAASPALIEKVRTVVSDGNGQYRIVDLRPGAYTVTFSIPGFNTIKRDGITLTGSFTASVDAQLRVGAIEETITVTGEAPVIDVQSTNTQRVVSTETIEALPTGRLLANIGVLVPGVSATSNGGAMTGSFQDVGGSTGDQMTNLVAHGSRADNARITTNGINSNAISGYMGGRSPNPASVQEVTIDTGGANAEAGQGGPRMNMIPREGGNEFKGTFFAGFANSHMQGDNLNQSLIDRGLPVPNKIEEIWDVNPGFGGPIARNRVWFYATARRFRSDNFVGAGVFHDLNANNPAAWTYNPDLTRPAVSENMWWDTQARITWQVNAKNKLAISSDVQKRFGYRWIGGNISAPEAVNSFDFPQETAHSADWTAPLTSRLLVEAGAFLAKEGYRGRMNPEYTNQAQLISVTEQSNGRVYRASATQSESYNEVLYTRLAMSYVTGTHAFKVGYNDGRGYTQALTSQVTAPIAYRFNNGVANQLTQYATPYTVRTDLDHDLGLFAQDKWTIDRLTLNLGVRFDYRASSFPEQRLSSSILVPGRNITLAGASNESLKDITPKLGLAYDVFGNGRTAVKVTLNKYLQGTLGNTTANPASSIANSTTRAWTDRNGDYVADCNLIDNAANGECGAVANTNFGKPIPGTRIDPEALTGWGNRNYNWEFSTGVQQEILPRVAMDVSFYRRWYGNFLVTDNLAVSASDYTAYSITAPANTLLPDGGGYTVTGYRDLNPDKFGVPADNLLTLSKNYGNQSETYNGVDFSLNARLQSGILLQGGFSSGKRVMDNCDVSAKVPEMMTNPTTLTYGTLGGQLPLEYCRQETRLETQVKMLGVYTVPRIGVQVSGTFQNLPGQLVFANFNAPNALVAQTLGRNLSGNAANATLSLIDPGSKYGDRINQVDMRFGKIVRFGRMRTSLNVDVYNLLNSNPRLVESTAYATFRQPQQIMMARFAKVGLTLDF